MIALLPNTQLYQLYVYIIMNPATEAAGPCVNKKLGGGPSANHETKIIIKSQFQKTILNKKKIQNQILYCYYFNGK